MNRLTPKAAVAFVALVIGATLAHADSYTFTTIDVPGATGTQAQGINNSGVIVGTYQESGTSYGFIDDAGTFTTIDIPGSTFTEATDINNNGLIVGTYDTSTGEHVFIDNAGTFTTIDAPGAVFTESGGINDSGDIGGQSDANNGFLGFLYSGGTFVSTSIDPPNTAFGSVFGLNNSDDLVGGIYLLGGTHGDGYVYSGGIYTLIDDGPYGTYAVGINDYGVIVGDFYDGTTNGAFVDDGGVFTTVDDPNQADGSQSGSDGLGINDNGQIVGDFVDVNGVDHGFLATPTTNTVPEPSTLLLLGSGLLSLLAFASRRRSLRSN